MFKNHARKLILALALCAIAGSTVPDSQAAAASIASSGTAAEHARWEVEQVKPRPPLTVGQNKQLILEVQPPDIKTNGITTYHFKLRAVGGPHGAVKLEKGYIYTHASVWSTEVDDNEMLGTIHDGEVKHISVMCRPVMYTRCTSADVYAKSLEGVQAYVVDHTEGKVRLTDNGY